LKSSIILKISTFDNIQEISKVYGIQKSRIQVFENTNFRLLMISKHLIFDSKVVQKFKNYVSKFQKSKFQQFRLSKL
jgi:predicted XRE-type DNA-binding protein